MNEVSLSNKVSLCQGQIIFLFPYRNPRFTHKSRPKAVLSETDPTGLQAHISSGFSIPPSRSCLQSSFSIIGVNKVEGHMNPLAFPAVQFSVIMHDSRNHNKKCFLASRPDAYLTLGITFLKMEEQALALEQFIEGWKHGLDRVRNF